MRTLGIAVIAAACAACIPPVQWMPAEPTFTAPNAGYAVELPAGWMRLADASKPDELLLTRDGRNVGRILVASDEIGHKFIVGDSKRVLATSMSPQEAAEAVIDGLESDKDWTSVKVLENAPAMLAGRKGFRIVATYKEDGLRMGIVIHGVVIPTGVFYVIYQAPERVYFQRHLPIYEKLVASFQLRPDAKGMKWKHPEEEEKDEEKNDEQKMPDVPPPSAFR